MLDEKTCIAVCPIHGTAFAGNEVNDYCPLHGCGELLQHYRADGNTVFLDAFQCAPLPVKHFELPNDYSRIRLIKMVIKGRFGFIDNPPPDTFVCAYGTDIFTSPCANRYIKVLEDGKYLCPITIISKLYPQSMTFREVG